MKNDPFRIIYDVCVVGSGPAGIILSLEYTRRNPNFRLLLLEYGFDGQNPKNSLDEKIQISSYLNHHDPYECTNKGLGGTSASWGGRCVMYDEVDFVNRPVLAGGCTWSIDLYKELDAYISRTAQYFECGRAIFNLKEINDFHCKPIAQNFKEGIVTDTAIERWSMPTRFGDRYVNEIADQANLTLIQGYEARDFTPPNSSGEISFLIIRNVISGECKEVRAKYFVLAAGTQETTRILLRNQQIFKRLEAPPNALGKYYQGHISGKIASVKFYGDPNMTDYGFLQDQDGVYIRRRFQFSTKFLVEKNLLNTAIWLDNPLYYDPKHRNGAMSFMYLAMLIPFLGRKLAPPAIVHSITNDKTFGFSKHVFNILRDLPNSLLTPALIFYRRYCKKRKLPGVFLFNKDNHYALHFHAEQAPSPTNQMRIAPDGETLIIDYSLSDVDIRSVLKLHEVLDAWLRKCKCGELEYWYPYSELPKAIRGMSRDGIHQSGTTRIGDTSEEGVIDRDLRVWGTQNIFVCSCSAFPTSSQANPTFLLGAFAVRLAKHLRNHNEKN